MNRSNGGAAARFASFAKSARFQLGMGLAIAGAGLSEVIEEVAHFVELGEVGAMHGVVLVGLLHAAKGLGEVIEGGERTRESREARDKMSK